MDFITGFRLYLAVKNRSGYAVRKNLSGIVTTKNHILVC